jgi:phytoene desaturase
MLCAARGLSVLLLEKDATVGGRNKQIRLGDFTFDTGPTFLNLPFILQDIFNNVGKNLADHLELRMLDPLYDLVFYDKIVRPTTDQSRMRDHVKKLFPGNEKGIDRFYAVEEKRFRAIFPCLQKDYSRLINFLHPDFIKALPRMFPAPSVFSNLGHYFSDDDLKLCFTFQAKYLGMSPWECPGIFTMLSFMEHKYGVAHVIGGLNKISETMAAITRQSGGEIRLNAPVKSLILDGKKVKGVRLENGEEFFAKAVIMNADFAYAMSSLVEPHVLKKYSMQNLMKKQYSCATFMLYLGLNRVYDLGHHNIYFARSYKENVTDIFNHKRLSKDISFYIQNACVTDPTLAPKGKSTLYVLVPVPNNFSGIDWTHEKAKFREFVIAKMIERAGLSDLRDAIEVEKVITPNTWEHEYNVFKAAEFNLAHIIPQMLYFRPHNKFEELDNCYLVGGGTHPGSGLPTIYESARISTNLLFKKLGFPPFIPTNLDQLLPH